MFRTLFLILAATCTLTLAARAQGVDEIIARNIQARGGMERLESVRTIRITAKFSSGPLQATFRQSGSRPDKVREEFTIQGLTQVRAYDGKTGWQVDPFEGRRDAELLAQDDMKDLVLEADIDGPLVDYKRKGHQAQIMGHDSVEGTDCYKIKLTLKNGDVRYYYLDADSLLQIKVESQVMVRGAIQESETYYGDYEQVQGVYFPFAYDSGRKGDPNRTKLTVEKIEINLPVDGKVFSVPSK